MQWLLFVMIVGCAALRNGAGPADAVRQYLTARTRAEAVARMAPEYRLWFAERRGEGTDRAAAAEMLQWDFALHASHRIDSLTAEGNVVTAIVHEDNDFSRFLGYPGWDSTSTFIVNGDGRITEQLYVPKPGQPDWRSYLDAALPWIRAHRADALPTIYPDGKLARSAEAARLWAEVLREWRAAGVGER